MIRKSGIAIAIILLLAIGLGGPISMPEQEIVAQLPSLVASQ